MHYSQLLLLASFLASNVAGLPLNINLGAYSPALVVGDGEISFGGKQDVSNLMNALEGAAVSGAAAAAAAPAAAVVSTTATTSAQAATATIVPTEQGNTQITALQGMGKEIAPRIVSLVKTEKRDINGFNAALKYATDALKTSPKVQLGTEAAGVGILQDAGISAPATAAGKTRSLEEIKERDVLVGAGEKKLRTTVTTMIVRGGPAPAQVEARNIGDASVKPVEKRAPAPALSEGVNLNMAEGQVAELTFVETKAVGEDDE